MPVIFPDSLMGTMLAVTLTLDDHLAARFLSDLDDAALVLITARTKGDQRHDTRYKNSRC
jgi:ABC-type spermidine/putrescine transport system permease subunit II